ncbi:MAG TPA: hypothetical protein VLE51_00170 [Candidatus Saccharimonadales bacterium]|nr:hypothetical protein [Candidatus Saccharimonadales bacterium]
MSWATPSVSTGKVTYGTNLDDQNQSVSADTALASHQVTLTNLQPGQKYYFTISASYANNQYKYQGEVTTAGGSYSSQPTPTATSKSPKTLALIAIAILGLSGSAAWFFLSGGRHKKLGLPGANPFQHILMHEAVLHHPTAHTPAHAPPKEAPPVHHLPPKVETPPKPEPPQKPLPPNPNIPYQPHSLIPKDKLAGHAKKTGSIAADSIDEPKDMFEEGRERLEHEGLGKDGQPQ